MIQERYDRVLKALEAGARFLGPISTELAKVLMEALRPDHADLVKCLCVLENTSSFLPQFEMPLIELVSQLSDGDHIIFTLNALRRHCIAARARKGNRLPPELLETLKGLLSHGNPEVIEWSLRTLDECGNQAILLRKDIQAIRPSGLGLLKKQNRTILELCTYLDRKWPSESR